MTINLSGSILQDRFMFRGGKYALSIPGSTEKVEGRGDSITDHHIMCGRTYYIAGKEDPPGHQAIYCWWR